jgi:hypothetical protein
MPCEGWRCYVEFAFGDSTHQIDSPAGAVVFVANLLIGLTGRQAQPAVNATKNLVHLGVERCLK